MNEKLTIRRFTDTVESGIKRIVEEQRLEIEDLRNRCVEIELNLADQVKTRLYGKAATMDKPQLRAEYRRLDALMQERDAANEWLKYQLAKRGEG